MAQRTPARYQSPFYPLQTAINELFRDFDRDVGRVVGGVEIRTPDVDVSEDNEAVYVHAELPGMKADDIDVNVNRDLLTISGEKKSAREEKKQDYHLTERSFGRFERTLRLPAMVDVNKVHATFRDGVLEMNLPKTEPTPTGRKIKIKKG